MYEKKKILVESAFEQAKKELKKENASKNYVAEYLNAHFENVFGSAKTEKMFERYYTDLVQKNIDRYIDEITLDQLSKYIGYKNYDDFCENGKSTEFNESSGFTTVNVNIDEKGNSEKRESKFIINITTNPIFKLQEFFAKQSNIGIIGALFIAGILGNKYIINKKEENSLAQPLLAESQATKTDFGIEKKETLEPNIQFVSQENNNDKEIIRIKSQENQCMFWDGQKYIPENCNSTQQRMVALDLKLVVNFKKITTPDTITEKSIQKIWYSKSNNKIEFFTSDGENPENGKELKHVTKYIWTKYIFNKIYSD